MIAPFFIIPARALIREYSLLWNNEKLKMASEFEH